MKPSERRATLPGGEDLPILQAGEGEPLCFLAVRAGPPRWTAFLERLARERRVVAPALPDLSPDGADRIATTLDLLDASGCDGADLVGASLGGLLAAEAAAFSRASVRRLVLISPLAKYGLERRLHRVQAPTLCLWGEDDRVLAADDPKRFADALGGFVRARRIEGAGHEVEVDAPEACAAAVLEFLDA